MVLLKSHAALVGLADPDLVEMAAEIGGIFVDAVGAAALQLVVAVAARTPPNAVAGFRW